MAFTQLNARRPLAETETGLSLLAKHGSVSLVRTGVGINGDDETDCR